MSLIRRAKSFGIMVRRHRWAMLGTFAAVTLSAFLAGSWYPKEYVGSAAVALAPGIDSANQHAAIRSLLQQLPTQQDLTSIVTQYHLNPGLPGSDDQARANEYLLSKVSIEEIAADQGGEQVQLQYTSSDHHQAQGITNALAQSLTRAVSPAVSQPAPAAIETPVVTEPPVRPPAPLVRSRHRRGRAGRPLSVAAIQKKLDQANQLQASLEDAAAQNQRTFADLKFQHARLSAQAKVKSAKPAAPTPAINPEVERAQTQLAEATKKLNDLRDRYTDEYPDVIAQKERVAELQLVLSEAQAAARTAAAASATQQAQHKLPANVIAALAATEAQQDNARIAQQRLEDEIESNRMVIARLTDQLNKAKAASGIAAGAPEDDQPVAQPASAANFPAAPVIQAGATPGPRSAVFVIAQPVSVRMAPMLLNPQFLWPISLALGFLAALLAVFIAERHDPSIKNEGMLRHEIPPSAVYLGGIPRIRHEIIVE